MGTLHSLNSPPSHSLPTLSISTSMHRSSSGVVDIPVYPDYIDPPWCVKMEFTKGCNLRCSFCPVAEDTLLQTKDSWEYMSPSTLRRFGISYSHMREKYPHGPPRIEIALRGEPLINPRVEDCLRAVRDTMNESQITLFSNGTQLLKDDGLLVRLFDAGLNVLYLDCYNGTYNRFLSHCERVACEGVEIYDAKEFTPYRRHPRGYKRRVVSLIVGLEDQENSLSIRPIHNVGGNANPDSLIQLGWKPKNLPLEKTCSRVFREITLHLTGDIVTCCVDWYPDKTTTLGNIRELSVEEIWYGEKHLTALRKLHNGDRTWGLCKTCDYNGGYRLGFLHNPYLTREEIAAERAMKKGRKG
jgi:radical SAM protein with 4Fe4S-binding SPASM domain